MQINRGGADWPLHLQSQLLHVRVSRVFASAALKSVSLENAVPAACTFVGKGLGLNLETVLSE